MDAYFNLLKLFSELKSLLDQTKMICRFFSLSYKFNVKKFRYSYNHIFREIHFHENFREIDFTKKIIDSAL